MFVANNLCRAVNLILLLPTLAFVVGLAYFTLQTKTQVETLRENVAKREIIIPSFEELRLHAEGTHSLVETRFTAWASAYDKKYESETERRKRLGLFASSARLVQEHNNKIPAGSDKYRLGLNEFADMSDAEFMARFNFGNMKGQQECSATAEGRAKAKPLEQARPLDLPESIDWRAKGIVSPVKNQGRCGSCWTFSSTGALEALHKKKTGKSVSLSEQQLLDCAGNYDNHGCNGGLPSHAFQYILENGGLDTEKAYPYEMKSEGTKCRFRKWGVGVKVHGVHNITQFNEMELEMAVGTVGPVSIAFQVASDFRLYAGGVYDSAVCQNQPKDVNHAVLAVGYGVTNDKTKYWIVKNSWGTAWGEKGYFMMKRGVNMCGVSDCASYPKM